MSFGPEKLGGPYSTVFDIGAFRGDFARSCRARWPEAMLYSFEPIEPPPDDLDPHWEWMPFALGEADDITAINECEFVPSSSFLPMAERHKTAFPYTRNHTRRDVVVRRLDDYANLVDSPALLKLDVQGYEMHVLRGGLTALGRFDGVVCEVSWEELYEGAPSFAQLDSLFREYGFKHRGRIDEMPDPKRKRVIMQSDELWLRD